MRKLTVHARTEIALATVLLLASCGDDPIRRYSQKDAERLRSAEVTANYALERIDDLESRVSKIENRLD